MWNLCSPEVQPRSITQGAVQLLCDRETRNTNDITLALGVEIALEFEGSRNNVKQFWQKTFYVIRKKKKNMGLSLPGNCATDAKKNDTNQMITNLMIWRVIIKK